MGTRHPQALYLSLDHEVSFMPLRVGWHLDVRVLPIGITRERRMKPPGPDLTWGEASAPVGPMERHLPLLTLTYAW
jgi:hypothetical protein